ASTLGRSVAIDELDDRHRGVVAVTEARLHDAQVPAVALRITRRDGLEQALDDALVADLGDNLTASMQVAALAQRDELLDDRAQILRLFERGDDLLVLDERHGEVGEHRLAVAYAAGEATAFETVAHGCLPSSV